MPRPPRTDFPNAVYHVTSRGNGRAEIFHSDEDRQRFFAQLAQHLHQCGVVLYAFVREERLARLEGFSWGSYGGYAVAAKAQEFVN